MNICYIGGAGRLGYPLAYWSAQCGFDVIIADTNEDAVEEINEGRYEPYEKISSAPKFAGSIVATVDIIKAVSVCELVFVIVPTPSETSGAFNIEYVLDTCAEIGEAISQDDIYRTVVIVSTVNPGDTDSLIRAKIQKHAGKTKRVGVDFGLVYSPEFVRQGSIMDDFAHPDVLLLGSTHKKDSVHLVKSYYNVVTGHSVAPESVHYMSPISAEIAKITLNTALNAKMAVANQTAWLCHLMPGADAKDVLAAVGGDKRIGPQLLKPGTPPGGPCLPRDNRALASICHTKNVGGFLPVAAAEFTEWQVSAICLVLGGMMTTANKNKPCILGLTYKTGVDIYEESAGMRVFNAFADVPMECLSYDPGIDGPGGLAGAIEGCDFLVIMTPWEEFKELQDMDLSGVVVFDMWRMFEDLDCETYVPFGVGRVRSE